jgi:hypothetical protein
MNLRKLYLCTSLTRGGLQSTAENYEMGKLLDQNGELMTGLVEYKGDTYVTKYHYKNGLKDGYGGLFSGSHEYQTWCYQDGVSLEEDDPYCNETRDNI